MDRLQWPIELGLQFFGEVQICEIELLVHESKIPQKIEIFISELDSSGSKPRPYKDCTFKRLGHTSFQPNHESDYRARELKTVFVSAHTAHLKLLVHECHPSPYNRFNQVGIIAINVLGTPLTEQPPPPVGNAPRLLADLRPPSLRCRIEQDLTALEGQFDNATFEKLWLLHASKARAIEDEDYEAAKYCKQRIESLKAHASRLKELESLKQQALAVENYDQAQAIKQEADTLRNLSASISPYPPQNLPGDDMVGNRKKLAFAPHAPLMPQSKVDSPRVVAQLVRQPSDPAAPLVASPESSPVPEPSAAPNSPPVGRRASGGANRQGFDPMADPFNSRGVSRVAFSNEVPAGAFSTMLSREPRPGPVSPTVPKVAASADSYDPTGLPDWARELYDEITELNVKQGVATSIVGADTAMGAVLTPVVGQYAAMCLLGKDRALRDVALRAITARLQKRGKLGAGTAQVATACCQYLALKGSGLSDPNLAVYFSCLALLDVVAELLPSNTIAVSLAPIIPLLLVKIADTHQRIREQTQQRLLAIAQRGPAGFDLVAHHLLDDPEGQASNQSTANPRRLIIKLGFVEQFLQSFGVPRGTFTLEALARKRVFPATENPNMEVRQAAIHVAALLHQLQPAAMEPLVRALKPALQVAIREEAEGTGVPSAAPARGPTPRLEEQHVVQHGPERTDLEEPESPVLLNPEECHFCFQAFPGQDMSHLERHMESECPMLTECACGQVVEISDLQRHLMEGDCERAREVKQCGRCGDFIMGHLWAEHEERPCEPPPGPDEQRCTLCHTNMPAGDQAWGAHLLEPPGCPASNRPLPQLP